MARLDASFEGRDGRTVPLRRSHQGPLRLQRMLYPEGPRVCHAIVVHPPGGVAGGDELTITIDADHGGHALLTTPGAAKWYRSAGRTARQCVRLSARTGATIEWLPQEGIVFDGASATWTVDADIDESAAIVGLDIVMLGRAARGERFEHGAVTSRVRLSRRGAPVLVEQWRLLGNDARLDSSQGLGGARCFGTLWAVADTQRLASAMEAVREALQSTSIDAGATLLPAGVLLARAVGAGPEAVRRALERAWSALRRPVLGIEAKRPRIWAT